MSSWAVVAIVAIVMSGLVKIFTGRHHGPVEPDPLPRPPAPGAIADEAAQRELRDLRERIAVLERIATDGETVDARETRRIAAEIEALRTPQD